MNGNTNESTKDGQTSDHTSVPDTTEGDMVYNKKRYDYPIDAIRYHFTQFNVWVGFFIGINGALLVAYNNVDTHFNLAKIFLLLLGYIASLLFHGLSKVYHFSITGLSVKINELATIDEQDIALKKFFQELSYTKTSTTWIVCTFSFILTFPWGILLILKIISGIEKLDSSPCATVIGFAIASVFTLILNCVSCCCARNWHRRSVPDEGSA
jgi:hypothetical protein